MKKIISLLLVMILLCTGCAGGKTSGEEEVEGGKDKKDGIRLYVLSMNDELQSYSFPWILKKFEEMYPGYKVYLEIGVTEENGITMADAIRNLNVEMMSGNGPDVLFLDGLPIHEYIEKGMLEDMSGLLRELKNNGEVFFENVLSAYEKNGKICAVPIAFTVPVVVGDEKVSQVETIHEFAELAEQKVNNVIPVFGDMWKLYFPEIFRVGWNDVVSDNQKVDKEVLAELLKSMKKIAEASGFDKDLVYPQMFEEMGPLYGSYGYWIDYLLRDLLWENIQMTTMTFDSSGDLHAIKSARKMKPITYEYFDRQNGNLFFPKQIVGINVSSKKKKEAETLVKYFFSAELQQEDVGYSRYDTAGSGIYGLLVNKGNLEKELGVSEKEEVISEWENFSDPEKETIYTYNLTPSELQEFFTFLDKADTMFDMDYMLCQSIMDLVENYIFERETLESTVEEIANKVELYQAE